MGAKDSKPSFITYDDAVKKVSDNEIRRIREAFKKCSGANGTTLSVEAFVHEVLCDGVPLEVAEWLFQTCGGTKRGISFKDLLCGLVVLTKGTNEEKIKLLWTLYVNNQFENGTYIYKMDFARTLHLENTSLPVTGAPRTAEILTGLFGSHGEKATFDQFRSWLLIHNDATVLSKWLLTGGNNNNVQDSETPTFYQSLAGVTHLEERDIIELEKCFWSLRNMAATGQLDAESFTSLLSPPLPNAAVNGVFLAFDENRDGHVDFKELCCGLSAACRGPRTERLKFCFKIFDVDRDSMLNKRELVDMVSVLTLVANELLKHQNSRASTPSSGNESDGHEKNYDPDVVLLNIRDKLVAGAKGCNPNKPMFQLGPTSTDVSSDSTLENTDLSIREQKNILSDDSLTSIESEGVDIISEEMVLTQEDFLIWSVETAENLVTPFLDLIFEVCHVVLGLRPQCKHQERDIVQGWLNRELQREYRVGQLWYLISSEWWANWLVYTATGSTDTCCRQIPRPMDEAIVCDESFISNSTESMGSLLYRADTVSLASAASSSGVSSGISGNGNSARPIGPRHPGPIDNKRLITSNVTKVRTLTGEGGTLRQDVTLAQHRDFELVPDKLWGALALWYGGPDPLPRQVIRPPNCDVEIELYPLHLKLLRHVVNTQRINAVPAIGGVSMYSSVPLAPAPPERQLAYTAAFSRLSTIRQVSDFLCSALNLAREDMRLWAVGAATVLLDDDRPTLDELGIDGRQKLLIEVRNADLTWPEEIGALSMNSASGWSAERRGTLMSPNLPGATGLHNLGNTCFMNAALQSVWNTGPLTRYFNSGMHLYEVNTTNPAGTKGALAMRYGELCKEVWSCSARSVAPLRVRWCVSRYAPELAGGGQHDAQELLAWLLDTLHEELNRARPPPVLNSVHSDSDGRADQVVATEAWNHHIARNKSIMTDLFYGQLKSKVRCNTCGRESVRFDAFNMLSLPLPMESYVRCEIRVILLDGSVPVKYGVRVNSEGTYSDLKKRLSNLCGLTPESMLLVELIGATVGRTFDDNTKIKPSSASELYIYEIPDEIEDNDSGTDCELDYCEQDHPHGWTVSEHWPEVSRPRASNTSSLCMPALFCFKRSKSEIIMSQSPPNTMYNKRDSVAFAKTSTGDYKCNTLPKDLNELKKTDKNGNSSPTLSVKSLNMKPSSPHLGKIKFGSSPSNMNRMNEIQEAPMSSKIQYLVAVHRKQCRADAYFLPSQRCRPALFGVPLLVGLKENMSGRELYARVWTQVARLLSARPPSQDQSNHATDCDDSLGYEFPFTLRVVNSSGSWCAICPWPNFCRGCTLPSTDEPLVFNLKPKRGNTPKTRKRPSLSKTVVPSNEVPDTNSPIAKAKLQRQCSNRIDVDTEGDTTETHELSRLDFCELRQLYWRPNRNSNALPTSTPVLLAIDWDPTALHLRYQSTREKAWLEHESVRECMAEAARPVDLDHCLRAFTAEERLEEPYGCAACRSAQPATKKLQIWRLPPIMIVHLKRFQYVNNKWIKSQKIVNFPFQEFDPTAYLASVPQETILRHQELKFMFKRRSSMFLDSHISESDSSDDEEKEKVVINTRATPKTPESNLKFKIDRRRRESAEKVVNVRERLESTSLVTTPVTDDNLVDYHEHRLTKEQDPFDLKYRLYAVVSHSGQMSGGHYVAYARNPSGTWLCYNDSSCREITPSRRDGNNSFPPIDPASAYLLFYERQGLDYEPYLPDITNKEPVIKDSETLEGDDNDLRKMCSII